MSDRVIPKTFGEKFILGIESSEVKGLLFESLEDTLKKHYPQHDITKHLVKLSDFNSVVTYQAKLAVIRIMYNANTIREIEDKIVALADGRNEHKERMIKKLNLLINNNPGIDDLIYICMSAYIIKGYGSAKTFKTEFGRFVKG